MDDAKDFIGSILKTIRDRLGNPLVSAFALAWLIWNFRIVLVLFGKGDGGWLAKIDYLDKKLMVPSWMWAIHGLIIPLAIALIWIFLLPSVLRKIAVFHEKQTNKTKGVLLEILEASPISSAERSQMWAQMLKERKAWDAEREELLKAVSQAQSETVSTLPPSDLPSPSDQIQLPASDKALIAGQARDSDATGFFDMSVAERARFLGLNVIFDPNVTNKKNDDVVSFMSMRVSWPWVVRREGLYGLSEKVADNVSGKMFSEFDLWVLHTIREESALSIERANGNSNLFSLRAAIDQLAEARLVSRHDTGASISTFGRLFLAWLLRAGFSFKEVKR